MCSCVIDCRAWERCALQTPSRGPAKVESAANVRPPRLITHCAPMRPLDARTTSFRLHSCAESLATLRVK